MDRRDVVKEVLLLWLITLFLIRLVVVAHDAGMHEIVLAFVPILFMYTPVWLCKLRGVDDYDYPLALPAIRDRKRWFGALNLHARVFAALAVPTVIGYHLYQTTFFSYELQWTWPENLFMLIGYHLFFVAIPEELFYRGYIQTRLDEVYRPQWNILGAKLGWGWIITCVVFAIGHSLVEFQWWHVFIFFPSLVFGWMRARSGGIMAGAFFHATCNIGVATLDALYGVQAVLPP